MKNETSKQHYIPRFLLKRFAKRKKKNPQLWVYDKQTSNIFLSSINDIGHQNNFYEYHDDENHIELEASLMKIDSAAANIINQILKSEKLILSEHERNVLTFFIACQIIRTPSTEKDIEFLRNSLIKMCGPNVRCGNDHKTIGEYDSKIDKFVALSSMKNLPSLSQALAAKVWLLARSANSSNFLISDNPVVRHNGVEIPFKSNLGLDNEGIEVYFPISSQFCIGIICPNLARAASITGRSLIMSHENMQFMNSLQVIYAERYIFAKDKSDLNIVSEMLTENPDLRSGRRPVIT